VEKQTESMFDIVKIILGLLVALLFGMGGYVVNDLDNHKILPAHPEAGVKIDYVEDNQQGIKMKVDQISKDVGEVKTDVKVIERLIRQNGSH